MSFADKVRYKVEELRGRSKKEAGRLTRDRSTEAKGRAEQTAGKLKGAGEKAKDTFRR
jgi:uncharacterized protein YjbJ (UPF0337 family)